MPTVQETWKLLANPVTVSYVRRLTATTYAPPVTVTDCQVKMMTQSSITGGGVMLRLRRLTANIWRDRLLAAGCTAAPKPHDVVIIDNARHTVTEVEHCGRAGPAPTAGGEPQRFRCFLEREG